MQKGGTSRLMRERPPTYARRPIEAKWCAAQAPLRIARSPTVTWPASSTWLAMITWLPTWPSWATWQPTM